MEEAEQNLSQDILRKVVQIYQGNTGNADLKGLCQISKDLKDLTGGQFDFEKVAPRNRLTVMIIGNHSSGKSSFINWYTGDNLRETGQAILTHTITLVSHGKRRRTLQSEGTIDSNPHLASLQTKFPELMPCLQTQYCTSTKNAFKLIDFIDTPGLVATGKSNNYEYPVNEVIAELTQCVDHILVFFDPIQKAMIPRTLEVLRTIETLDRRTAPRVDFVLTKIDTINSSGDLLDVTGNVQGQLATALNIAHGQRTWRICLPDKGTVAPDMQKANELKQLMECFVDQIHGKVEKNLVILKRDVVELRDQTQLALAANVEDRKRYNAKWWAVFGVGLFQWLVIPLIMAVVLVPHVLEPEDVGEKANAYSQALHFLQQVNHVFDSLLNLSPLDKAGIFVGAFLVVFIVRRCLLQKQLSALREKVISKQGEQTLRTNLAALDVIAEMQVENQQRWNNHIRISNEDVVDEHS